MLPHERRRLRSGRPPARARRSVRPTIALESPLRRSVLMVRSRGAADGAMMPSFGRYELQLFRVCTDEVTVVGAGDLKSLLQEMPDAPALTLASAGTA
jgi:hypothetical protein